MARRTALAEELARTIHDALERPKRLLRFGKFNRARQEQLFSLSGFGSEWEQFLARRSVAENDSVPAGCLRTPRPTPSTCWATRSRRRVGTRSSPKWTP